MIDNFTGRLFLQKIMSRTTPVFFYMKELTEHILTNEK